MSFFPENSRESFAASYPEVPQLLEHRLDTHPLLELDALAELAEWLPRGSIECHSDDQPIAVADVPTQLHEGIGAAVRNIGESGRWVGLRNVQQHPDYDRLLVELLDEVRPEVEAITGRMHRLESYIFISSPGAVTPLHFDPEHNILLQIRGSKTMTLFPAGDPRFAADELHESYHLGGRPELPWRDGMETGGSAISLSPGQALYVPVMAPHFVRNGPEPSLSLSITWRSGWSYAESDARLFNAMMRRVGVTPRSPGRWPSSNFAKAYGYRALRKIGVTRHPMFTAN